MSNVKGTQTICEELLEHPGWEERAGGCTKELAMLGIYTRARCENDRIVLSFPGGVGKIVCSTVDEAVTFVSKVEAPLIRLRMAGTVEAFGNCQFV